MGRWLCKPSELITPLREETNQYSIIYSTSYTTGFDQMMKEFHVNSEPVVTLGVTTYLIGLAVGSLILAPISETYGRRPVYVIATLIFTAFIAPCAKAHGLAEIIVLRFFGACAGSAFVANAPGTVADIITEDYRALAFSIWSIGPLNGPGKPIILRKARDSIANISQCLGPSWVVSSPNIGAGDGPIGSSCAWLVFPGSCLSS